MKKRKKGFTLIELVIVLAVLAIIALIAIPNFNKVRTDSQKKADDATCETIKGVTQMAAADEYFKVETSKTGKMLVKVVSNKVTDVDLVNMDWVGVDAAAKAATKSKYIGSLSEVKGPQEKLKINYAVRLDDQEGIKDVKTAIASVTAATIPD